MSAAGRRYARAHRLHAQDDAGPARLREICRALRRRRQPPLRPRRCRADQGQPHRRWRAASKRRRRSARRPGHMVKIEVEVDTLEQLERFCSSPVDAVLLDNMSTRYLARRCRQAAGRSVPKRPAGSTWPPSRRSPRPASTSISVGAPDPFGASLDLGRLTGRGPARQGAARGRQLSCSLTAFGHKGLGHQGIV